MAKQFKARDRLVAAFLLAMAIANGIEFWQQRARIKSGYGDFSALYTSGLLVRRGEGTSLYERHEQWRVQQQFAANVDIRKGPMAVYPASLRGARLPPSDVLFLSPGIRNLVGNQSSSVVAFNTNTASCESFFSKLSFMARGQCFVWDTFLCFSTCCRGRTQSYCC